MVNLSTSSLNTAIIDEDEANGRASHSNLSKNNANNVNDASLNESNNSRLLDMAFNEDDIEDTSDIEDIASEISKHPSNVTTTTTSSSVQSCSLSSKKSARKPSRSLSLSNLPDNSTASPTSSPKCNTTSVSDNSYPVIKKSVSDSLADTKACAGNENPSGNVGGELGAVANADEGEKKANESVNESLMKAISLEERVDVIAATAIEIKKPEKEQAVRVVEIGEPKLGEETFKFKIPDMIDSDDESMLQNVLRRQSLFKLKEKINGKVSKHISEIEHRKLSPYRFSNSPLKQRKLREQSTSKLATKPTKRQENTICRLNEIPEEQYLVKSSGDKLSSAIASCEAVQQLEAKGAPSPFRRLENAASVDSPTRLIKMAANKYFYKKFSKARNLKRLNATTQATGSPYSSENGENCPNRSLQQHANSPNGKGLIGKWKCSNETDVL